MQRDIFSKQFKSRKTLLTSLYKHYHSKNVFGYRPKTQTKYNLPSETIEARNKQSNFYRFVTAYRQHAHKLANVNPISLTKLPSILPEMDPERYNLNKHDIVDFPGILRTAETKGTVSEAIKILENVYKNTIGVEFLHLESEEEVEWFAERTEILSQEPVDNETKIKIATELLKSQAFDNFLGIKFASLKRYGGEGAESMMAFFTEFLKISSLENIEQVVLCIPHRGRLNLLTGMLELPPGKLFRKLKGLPDFPAHFNATGDVISHLVSSVDLTIDNKEVHVTMLYNPSHLEAVNPVSMGKTRAKQMVYSDGDYGKNTKWSDKILNLQVHGDAAYAGQGINQECLALSGTPHFEIGGSVHLIINNQLGFTTPSERGRSSRYCSDLAKIVSAPVIHVNGDYPEDVVKATRLAMNYQRKFRKEVFIDLNCYRRWGHNELDDPTFTNPALYAIIKSRKSVPDLYAEKLISEGILTESQVKTINEAHTKWLNNELKNVDSFVPKNPCFEKQWAGKEQASATVTTWDTGINLELMMYIGNRSVTYPKDFVVHPNLLKNQIKSRLSMITAGTGINWATAEALAMGSLMYQGYNVRISGQDVGRGTFSQRHAMLVDQKSNLIHIPLNNLDIEHQGHLEVANSILSEEAVLGFEYGMSIENPNNLIIWEAQFGDFFNGAQIIIDTFITSGETKWLTCSGLVMLLPHGYDGAGPEHSSCRLERFLQLSDSSENRPDGDDVNIQIVNPTTPAQYFHLLRRQMIRNFRKPLIIVAPKTLLRLSEATSALSDMAPGTTFLPVIDDNTVDPIKVTRVLLVSGKLYFSLEEQRKALNTSNVAIVRVECLSPFPTLHLQKALDRFPNVKAFIWCQEEPQNMGAWSYVFSRFRNLLGINLQYVGRETSAAPEVGVGQWHQEQMKKVVTLPFSYNMK